MGTSNRTDSLAEKLRRKNIDPSRRWGFGGEAPTSPRASKGRTSFRIGSDNSVQRRSESQQASPKPPEILHPKDLPASVLPTFWQTMEMLGWFVLEHLLWGLGKAIFDFFKERKFFSSWEHTRSRRDSR